MNQSSMSPLRATMSLLPLLLPIADVTAFVRPSTGNQHVVGVIGSGTMPQLASQPPSSSQLGMVWWFGGTAGHSSETSTSGEECELVAVRIDKTSPNSRRIAGEIVVAAPPSDVWAILTDYDNLSTHVPNLVASKRVSSTGGGEAGDGKYRCRLYQRGGQKIIGFEFGADVTMDMTESISYPSSGPSVAVTDVPQLESDVPQLEPSDRNILFKCVDSQFFSEFDGTWTVKGLPDNPFTGEKETTVSYTVEVRPKGPVPVAALEWRIREDVPTNLRAVKNAAIEVGQVGVMAMRNGIDGATAQLQARTAAGQAGGNADDGGGVATFADFILDYENETLGAYLAKV